MQGNSAPIGEPTTASFPRDLPQRPQRGAGLTRLLALITLTVSLIVALPALATAAEESGGGLLEGSPWLYVGMSILDIVFLVTLSIFATRNLKKVPGKLQNLLEMVVGGLDDFFGGIVGPSGQRHVPFLITIFLFILTMNLTGLVPIFKSPTSTLNETVALALTVFFYVQCQGICANGLWGYIRHFLGEPLWLSPIMLPIHIIGELAKPLSLSIRLFGNIFGEETVILQLALLGPVIFGMRLIPVQFPMMAFGVFTAVVQALVFSVLSAAYIVMLATEHEEEHEAREAQEARAPESAQSPAAA